MPKTPREVLEAISNEELLRVMAESKNIDVTDKDRETIIAELSIHISSLGLSVLLKLLKIELLHAILDKKWPSKKSDKRGSEKNRVNKATLVKRVHDTLEEKSGTEAWLKSCQSKVLRKVLKYLEIEIPEDEDDYVKVIMTTCDEMGLEHFLSSFSVSKLKELIKACHLKVDTDSMDTLLQCLIEQESIKAPFKTDEIPSKKKPDIDKYISVVDLHTHYFKEDLAEWCYKQHLSTNGSKKELVDRVRRFFDGKLLDRDKTKQFDKEQAKEKEKEKKRKKSRTDDDDSDSQKKEKRSKTEKDNKSSDSSGKKHGHKRKKETSSSSKREKKSNSSDSGSEEEVKKEKKTSNSTLDK